MTRSGSGGEAEGLKRLGAARPAQVAALDLGASKVACFIMTPDGIRRADRTVRVAHAGHVQSRGVRGGALVDMEAAAEAIDHAMTRAQRDCETPVSSVIVTTSIGQPISHRIATQV